MKRIRIKFEILKGLTLNLRWIEKKMITNTKLEMFLIHASLYCAKDA
jgi:hypothetical protein